MQELLNTLWVEKYRPTSLKDVIINDDLRKKLESFKESQVIPNMLFVGTAGIGKTSTARIITNEILDCETLTLNASDEGGIDIVRGKVKSFASSASFDGKIKVIIMGEADGLTTQAQNSLNEIIEDTHGSTRFIFTVNDVSKLTAPIVSRFQRFDITFSLREYITHLFGITTKESITIEDMIEFKQMCMKMYPDFRGGINKIQQNTLGGVFRVAECDDLSFTKSLMTMISTGTPEEARSLYIENSHEYGCFSELISSMADYVYANMVASEARKLVKIFNRFAVQDTQVSDRELNFYVMVVNLYETIREFKAS